MNRVTSLIMGLLIITHISASDIFQSVRVWNPESSTLQQLHELGIPLDHVQIKPKIYLDIIASQDQVSRLLDLGIQYDMLIPDLTQYYLDNNIPETQREFQLGSMLGNYTFTEAVAKMDSLSILFPNIVSPKDSIGTSIEGRTIWALKISNNSSLDENKPGVLFTGLTHAREPLGMMNQFYFIQWLCENYDINDTANYLVNERDIWFIPVLNPDGYVYNESIAPNGGGMHRKNRRDTGCGIGTQRGVDLNRNYGYEWGVDNSGSSPNACSAVFRGDSAFSEPETQAVRDFIINHNFSNVLHYHSYSNVLIHSYGNGTLPAEPDLTTIREIGREMTKLNGYNVGTGYETIGYGVNGDAVDWSYGDAGLISYTPEIGSYQDNFWPPENRVIPLCKDQLYANQIFSFISGADYDLYHSTILSQGNDSLSLQLTIQNRGLKNSDGDVVVDITASDPDYILNYNGMIGSLTSRMLTDLPLNITTTDSLVSGAELSLILSIHDNSSFIARDTLIIIMGNPRRLFIEDGESNLLNWTSTGEWGIILSDPNTGNHSITDSPSGNYSSNSTTSITLNQPIHFGGIHHPSVRFSAKWDIESQFDFVRFQISTDGTQWTSLEGLYTENGAGQGTQILGEQGYDGQSDWINEEIDLRDYSGESDLYFRFILTSDSYVNGDGFYFDNLQISGYMDYEPGDVNMSGNLDIFDVLSIVDMVLSGNELNHYQQMIGDVNNDSHVDMTDAMTLINIIISL